MPTPGLEKSSRRARSLSSGSATARVFIISEDDLTLMEQQFRTVKKEDLRDSAINLGPVLNLERSGSERGRRQICLEVERVEKAKDDESKSRCIAGDGSERIRTKVCGRYKGANIGRNDESKRPQVNHDKSYTSQSKKSNHTSNSRYFIPTGVFGKQLA